MSKSMLINVILEEESRVAIVDNGVLDFFEIETLTKETLKGNIYKAVVDNVNSSLEAAFVDCGWDRPGFLPLDEVNFKVLPAIKGRKSSSRIQEHIVPGMELLVQVIRDKFGTKPPSLTTYYSLPGRYLVLMPYTDSNGVSRRIEDENERIKLKKLLEDLEPPEKFGFIVRTAGLDQSRRELIRDMGYLVQLWETVERAGAAVKAPALIYRERNLALRTIRDQLTDDIEEVLIDDEVVYESALRFIRAIAPHQEPRIKLYSGDKPLFTRFNLEDQIELIYKRRVPLKSGGEIVIESTEAMTAIDVNSAKSREANVEEMAFRTNQEAAAEVARQLRLRDIGGLIVVDFIDMEQAKHLRAVEKILLEGMRRDKAKFDATKISKLGMLEISRQRLKAAKSTATYETCKACDGAGAVRTTEAAAISSLRRIQTRVVRGDISALAVTVPTEVALYLLNQQRDELQALEKRYHVSISLVPRPDFPKEKCEIEVTAREGPAPPPFREAAEGGKGRREGREVREPRETRETREPRGVRETATSEVPGAAIPPAAPPPAAADPAAGVEAGPIDLAGPAGGPAEDQPRSEARPWALSAVGHPPFGTAPWAALEGDLSETRPEQTPLPGWQMGGPGISEIFNPAEGLGPASAAPHAIHEAPLEEGAAETATAPREESQGPPTVPGSPESGARISGADAELQVGPPVPHEVAVQGVPEGAPSSAPPEGVDGGLRKRRRRRGGRGRGHKETPSEFQLSEPGPDEKEPRSSEGLIVWEDAEEIATPQARPRAAGLPLKHVAAVVTEESEAAAELRKKRRKRGGRGRKKKGPGEQSAVVPAPKPPTAPAARGVRKAQAERQARVTAVEEAGPKKKRRRRREKPHGAGGDLAPARPGGGGGAGASRGTTSPPSAPRATRPEFPGQGEEGEDVPGGWWSRLLGPKKRTDRED